MKSWIVIMLLLLCGSVWGEENRLIFESSDAIVGKFPTYYCPKHGEIEGMIISVIIDDENKYICPKCYNEFLYRNCEELREAK